MKDEPGTNQSQSQSQNYNNSNISNNNNNNNNIPSSSTVNANSNNISNNRNSVMYKQPVEYHRGGSSVYVNNAYDSNLLHQNSNIFGNNLFASPLSPDYNYNYNKPSSVTYYNMHPHADSATHFPPSASTDDNKNVDSSESYSQLMTSPKQSTYNRDSLLPEDIQPKLQNIVSTANFRCELDLREIALRAKNAEYNPKRFAAVIMRIREPKTTALIFASGKMVCTGARSEEDSKKAARQYAKIINKLGFNVKFTEFKVQNIVGSCDVKFPIRLEGLANSHSRFCNYEPEMFPGLIYRMSRPKIVLLVFVSGKIVLTGAKERNHIYEAFQNIYPVLLNFKKKESISISTDMTISAVNES